MTTHADKQAELPAMKTKPKFIFFTDFDGTITQSDSNDWMTDTLGYGQAKRKQGNKDTLTGAITFRDSFKSMMESIHTPYNECIRLLIENIKLDPGFAAFFQYALSANIPIVVLSSGMVPIIRALLAHMIGPEAEKIQIVANHVQYKDGKGPDDEDAWELVFQHPDSGFGHDKSKTIRPYADLPSGERPTLFYAGDGVSDLSAARETDLLFAKKGMDLVTYCVREEVPFTLFESWKDIEKKVREVVDGKVSVHDAAKAGFEEYKKEHGDPEKQSTK